MRCDVFVGMKGSCLTERTCVRIYIFSVFSFEFHILAPFPIHSSFPIFIYSYCTKINCITLRLRQD
jgi:hypothetical protein